MNSSFDSEKEVNEYLTKIKSIIIDCGSWISINKIAELLGVDRHKKLVPSLFNSTIAHLIHSHLKKQGFQTCRVNYISGYEIFVAPDISTKEDFPKEVLEKAITIKWAKDKKTNKTRKKQLVFENNSQSSTKLSKKDADKLRAILKEYRNKIAQEKGLPAYCIFENKSIEDIIKYLPTDLETIVEVFGFGKKRIEMYGDDIFNIIRIYMDTNPIIEHIEQTTKNDCDVEIVLECIRYFDAQFSFQGIIKILTGYKGFKYIPKVKDSEFYGVYSDIESTNIENAINYLISVDIVENDYKLKIKNEETSSEILDREEHEDILNAIFGFNHFKDWQWNIIEHLLKKQRILSIEKTGGGKSLCFQYTGNFLYNEGLGTTIVFSPLQALMREQVKYLQSIGIKAECLISEKSSDGNFDSDNHEEIYEKLTNNEIAILYIAPERLSNSQWIEYSSKFKIAMIVIDEAHCISTWGHDFRVDYRRIVNLVKLIPASIPILALTATANNIVVKDIKEQVGDLKVIRGNLERKNLSLNVLKTSTEDDKFLYLYNFIKEQDGNGIVYAGTRANTTIYSDWLNYAGIKSAYYHAGLSDDKRKEMEQDLKDGKYQVIVSTNALGMGMDKKDIRFVVHTQMPSSLIAYYQEIGRAGRDNLPSDVLLIYNQDDEDLQKYFIDTSKPSMKQYMKTLALLKEEPQGLYQLIKLLNTKKNLAKLILKDLEEREYINKDENSRYYFVKDMTDEDFSKINQIKQIRYEDLAKMLDYINLKTCRTQFICEYLDDNSVVKCGHCDNCLGTIGTTYTKDDVKLLQDFYENYFIYSETSNYSIVSSGYYNMSNIKQLIKASKYEHLGYFDDSLLERTLRAFYKYYNEKHFDFILYIPPTVSGDLVENFANRIADRLQIQIKDDLVKLFQPEIPLKEIKSKIKKRELMKNIFDLNNSKMYLGKSILLVDDIIDSGITIDEAAKMLLKKGVANVSVLTIAKTNVGDE